MEEGIVGGQGFAVDASMIRADAHGKVALPRRKNWIRRSRPGRSEYLAVLDDAAFGAATEVAPKFISPTEPLRVCRRHQPLRGWCNERQKDGGELFA